MKSNLFKLCALSVVFASFLFVTGCKKDQLKVNETKYYSQDFPEGTVLDPYMGGWSLTLNADKTADVLPGGDISYRGTYDIKGSKIKVKVQQTSETFNFEILSDTEIKEKQYGTVMTLKK